MERDRAAVYFEVIIDIVSIFIININKNMFKTLRKVILYSFPITLTGLWYLGSFKKIEIEESNFPGGTIVYIDWQGHIKDIK